MRQSESKVPDPPDCSGFLVDIKLTGSEKQKQKMKKIKIKNEDENAEI